MANQNQRAFKSGGMGWGSLTEVFTFIALFSLSRAIGLFYDHILKRILTSVANIGRKSLLKALIIITMSSYFVKQTR
jgi:hypothetical protein